VSEAQIRATFDEFAAAWNDHDVASMAACWCEGGSAVDPWGRFASGRDGVNRLLAGEHEGPMRESSYRVATIAINPLSESSAVATCEAFIDGVRAPNGRVYTLPHHIDAVLVADDGRWRFLSLHPSLPRA
jgi:uncharacterized protein (TIGR02246 family)